MIPVDLELAEGGYLRSADGRCRHIVAIERLAADTRTAGIPVYWGKLRYDEPGYYQSGRIVLAEWLFWCLPGFVRWVWGEELGHALLGPSEEAVAAFVIGRYADLIRLPSWAFPA